jgi:hypothetical protein
MEPFGQGSSKVYQAGRKDETSQRRKGWRRGGTTALAVVVVAACTLLLGTARAPSQVASATPTDLGQT